MSDINLSALSTAEQKAQEFLPETTSFPTVIEFFQWAVPAGQFEAAYARAAIREEASARDNFERFLIVVWALLEDAEEPNTTNFPPRPIMPRVYLSSQVTEDPTERIRSNTHLQIRITFPRESVATGSITLIAINCNTCHNMLKIVRDHLEEI
jgi:hypothetical protein